MRASAVRVPPVAYILKFWWVRLNGWVRLICFLVYFIRVPGGKNIIIINGGSLSQVPSPLIKGEFLVVAENLERVVPSNILTPSPLKIFVGVVAAFF